MGCARTRESAHCGLVFDLSYTIQSATQNLPSALYLDSEKVIDSFDTRDTGSDVPVTTTASVGQVVTPSLSSTALGFVPTRLDLYLGSVSIKDGEAALSVRGWDGTTMGGTSYANATVVESSLPDPESSWQTVLLSNGSLVPKDQGLAITAAYQSGSDDPVGFRSVDVSGGFLGLGGGSGGQLASSDATNWTADSDATLAYRFYGREMRTEDKSYEVTRQHLTAIDISLQRVADNRSPLQRRARTHAAPPILTGFATTGLSVDPVGMDLNADTSADWSHSAGTFPDGSLTDGIWNSEGELVYTFKNPSEDDVIRVHARMRSNDTLGPAIYGPYTTNDRDELLPVIVQLRDDQREGQELVVYNDTKMETQLLVLSGLPSGLIDIELTLVPKQDLLSIEVNQQPIAAVQLERVPDPGTEERTVRFGSSGGVAEFSSIELDIGGAASETSDGGGTVELNVAGIGIELF